MRKLNIKKETLKDGLSGLMRVHNEERLIEGCIDSVIGALDELIVMCNDCTDSTPEILERKIIQYPDKLRVFYYNEDILSFDLTKEEYEKALSLPDDSPRLYCNMCNFGLEHARYKYAVKIDTDQIYFADRILYYTNLCRHPKKCLWKPSFLIGKVFTEYFSFYRWVSSKCKKPMVSLLPSWLIGLCANSYREYMDWLLLNDKAYIAWSGLNVFKADKWYVPFDHYNVHPPYNGEGDTIIFKLSEETYFSRLAFHRVAYSVTEAFNYQKKIMYAGPVWFHLHANRYQCYSRVKGVFNSHPELFVPVYDFLNYSYRDLLHTLKSDKIPTTFQRTLFYLIHEVGKKDIKKHLAVLEQYEFSDTKNTIDEK
ncbi:MAG: hypothetical protein ACI3Z0_02435 [Candidatus Cryptobacteroides sp.]